MPDVAHHTFARHGVAPATITGFHATAHARSALAIEYGVKRLIDRIAAFVGLVVLSPLLAAIALAIRLDSRGPALFRQTRIGKDGRPFTFLKFRSMEDGNDPAIHRDYISALIHDDCGALKGEHGSYKIEDDPRVTRIGHFLRRSSLDELPQLWNVLRGEMSLVGPRPPVDYEVELYGAHERRRLSALPGITGLWQVSGRCRTTYQQMVDLDLAYIDDWSLALDLKILVRTVGVVLGRKGAW